jgi:hypothetical protein
MFTRHAIEDSNNIPIPHYAQPRTEPVRRCVRFNAQLSATTRRGLYVCPATAVYKATVREEALKDGSPIAITNS